MVHFYLPSFSVLGVRLYNLTLWFVFADIACFVVQLIGGAQATNTAPPDQALRGIRIYMAGISLQEAFIIVFVGFAVAFHMRLLKAEKTDQFQSTGKKNWRRLLYTIYLSLLLITVGTPMFNFHLFLATEYLASPHIKNANTVHEPRSESSSVSSNSLAATMTPTRFPAVKYISTCLMQFQCSSPSYSWQLRLPASRWLDQIP